MNTVTIDGKNYPVKYGISGTREVLGLMGAKTLVEAGAAIDKLPIDQYPAFVKAGLVNGAKVEKVDPPSDDVIEYGLDADMNLYYDCVAFFIKDNEPRNDLYKTANLTKKEEGKAEGN